MEKGISSIIASVIIVTIAVGLTSTAYIWGKPLIEKRQEASITERVYNKFNPSNSNSLGKIIEDVANNRGVRTLNIETDGIWKLNADEDSIEFTFASKTTNIAADTENPISLTSGSQCVQNLLPPHISPPNGTLGQDSSSVVCAKSTSLGDVFEITYKIWFRELYNNPFNPKNGFKIDLIKDPAGPITSSGRTIKITFAESTQQSIGGTNLITKKIKILLI